MLKKSTQPTQTNASILRWAHFVPAFFVLLVFAVSCTTNQTQMTPPPDFEPLAVVDLAAKAHDAEMVGQFTVTETAVISLFYTIPNIDTTVFDLSLSGPDGDSIVILHSEAFRTDDNGGGTWEQSLPTGEYHLLLTAPQTDGTLSVYGKYQ